MDTKMKAVRAGHKGAVTKLLKKFEEIQQSSEADHEEISTLLEVVTQKKRTLENINEKILEQTSDEDVAVEILESDEYIAKLPWKAEHPPLPTNKAVAFRRTESEPKLLLKYGEIIDEQEKRGFIERVDNEEINQNIKLHYIPHHPVKKKDSVTTPPIRIVYDCSCKQTPDSASLNDCLLNVPPKLNEVTAILLRFRLNKYAVSTDIEKAFLNVGLDIEDRDVTRFFWLSKPTDPNSDLTTYRFKSVLFGATCSPFILNAVLSKHLNNHPV
ncbi:Hypothetical predicted protein [Mytilus galloprovincialis]|uniref:Reverse transcriptase domain-containing protein n=1 Tax=Mytilus galloprovincialis TaxID=29158 RepID=A0A8B6DZF9_MYTGA|nr:Hypothetical predicted protein [Mytilus galloprovincialis]